MSSLAYVFFNQHRGPVVAARMVVLTDEAFLALFMLPQASASKRIASADAQEQANLMRFLTSSRR